MNKRIFSAIAASLVLSASIAACSSDGESQLTVLTYDGGNLIDGENGITYINAPMCFEPIATESEPYAECADFNLQLYAIKGLDTSLWLSEKYEGIGSIYYAEGSVTLPDISSFEANEIIVCMEDVITTGLGTITDQDDIDRIIEAYLTGDTVTIIPEGEVYKLKFASDKYEGIYFNLVYIEADGGENYIYDRSTKTCAAVGDALLEYLPRATES